VRYNAAVIIDGSGDPTIAHSVALLMEPHRGEWNWYALGWNPDYDGISVILDVDGTWIDVDAAGLKTSLDVMHYLGREGQAGHKVVWVRCYA
jgi:hypothetical protein